MFSRQFSEFFQLFEPLYQSKRINGDVNRDHRIIFNGYLFHICELRLGNSKFKLAISSLCDIILSNKNGSPKNVSILNTRGFFLERYRNFQSHLVLRQII